MHACMPEISVIPIALGANHNEYILRIFVLSLTSLSISLILTLLVQIFALTHNFCHYATSR
jgi:hypothetical protein